MKIKAYFVTYKNNDELNKTLMSFKESGITNYDYEINIVNNASDYPVVVSDFFGLKYRIIKNETRPSFSTGHLARNWNECLIDGFRDPENPDCDIVILSQNDNTFHPNVIDMLVEAHKKYSFIQNGAGDSFHSYTIDSVKKVGLWDERFCGIGFQEGDYLLRQVLFNKENSSITDVVHNRMHNELNFNIIDYCKPTGFMRSDIHHHASLKYHFVSGDLFMLKWKGNESRDCPWQYWDEQSLNRFYIDRPQHILYPYFEWSFVKGNLNYYQYKGY